MLVKLTTTKGRDIWINPVYVKGLQQKTAEVTEVYIRWGSGLSVSDVLKVRANAADVAEAISAAMPESAAYIAAVNIDEELRQQQEQAARAAATSG